jgi:hypothetical protein
LVSDIEEHRLRVFENKVMRKTFGSKRDEVTGSCRKLHNEELHNLYSSRSTIKMIMSRRMKWAGHVARMAENRNVHIGYWWEAKRKRHYEDQYGGWIILKWILVR